MTQKTPAWTMIHGDCRDNFHHLGPVDSIVTDPPYGLDFMGHGWDHGVPGVEFWSGALSCAKPGAHMLAFGGTRTFHRLTCAIEDAGWDIRDCLMWVYGCLDEKTECLTSTGWKRYAEMSTEDLVLQWDAESGCLTWTRPLEVMVYPYSGRMIRLKNRHTDQFLTPNHRVYAKVRRHSRDSAPSQYEVVQAGEIKRHWHVDIPMAGCVSDGIAVEHPYVIGWWMTDAWRHGDGKACMFSQSKPHTLKKLRDALSHFTHSEYVKLARNENQSDEHTFYVTGQISEYLLSAYPDRELTWDVMTWDRSSRKSLFDGLMDGDGSWNIDGHSGAFWSVRRHRRDVFAALCVSLGFRCYEDEENNSVYVNVSTGSTQIQSKHYTQPEEYTGDVWCIRVPMGAFVARRSGKPFITGNSGFPKSHNLKDAWQGWGTCLKPAWEPIILARKPITGTVANNVLTNGTGALNIDACRVEPSGESRERHGEDSMSRRYADRGATNFSATPGVRGGSPSGRWPANLIHDGSDQVTSMFPFSKDGVAVQRNRDGGFHNEIYGKYKRPAVADVGFGGSGSSARFFYCAKASKSERGPGNNHPTVKPTALMRYLCRLITPPGGVVLDPFAGSGSTGVAAISEGFRFAGIERDADYIQICNSRLSATITNFTNSQ